MEAREGGIVSKTIFSQIIDEVTQGHATRKQLYERLEQFLGRPIISYATSFIHPVSISDDDVDMILEVIQGIDLSNGIAVLISSPGGDGIAAERIINVLREFSGTKEFWAIVPSKAKSAGTMICLGASKILMGPSSELGPVDPQVIRNEDGQQKLFSVDNYIKSYDELFARAIRAKGNLQPFLQQLQRYDAREIQEYKSAVDLSEDITVRALQSEMMKGKSQKEIKARMAIFLKPSAGTKSHARPILSSEAEKCGIAVNKMEVKSDLWKNTYELYLRIDKLVSSAAAKCVESKSNSFIANAPRLN